MASSSSQEALPGDSPEEVEKRVLERRARVEARNAREAAAAAAAAAAADGEEVNAERVAFAAQAAAEAAAAAEGGSTAVRAVHDAMHELDLAKVRFAPWQRCYLYFSYSDVRFANLRNLRPAPLLLPRILSRATFSLTRRRSARSTPSRRSAWPRTRASRSGARSRRRAWPSGRRACARRRARRRAPTRA